MPAFFPPFAGDLAIVYALTGRTAEALDLAERAVRQAQSMQRLGRLSLIATHLGEVRLLAGQPAAAEADGRRTLALAEAHQERGNMVYALRLLGLAAAEKQPPDLDRARGHHAEALALAGELGMRPLAARCHLGLGRLAHRAGDVAGADKHLTEARALFQGPEVLDREGLGQDGIAGLGQEGHELVGFRVAGDEDHPRQGLAEALAQGRVEARAVEVRHLQVADDQVVAALLDAVEGFGAVMDGVHLVVVEQKDIGDQLAETALVLHHQDEPRTHGDAVYRRLMIRASAPRARARARA